MISFLGGIMRKIVLFILIFALLLSACDKNKTTEISNEVDNKTSNITVPESNPRKSLEEIGFLNKQ